MRYRNPVFPDYFADPFVWKHGGEYFAVGTGAHEAAGHVEGEERVFPLLRSPDLARWESAGNVLERPDPAFGSTFWAPEVACEAGRFWLYYSVGWGDKQHQIRVAVSDRPQGPYRDARETPLLAPIAPPFAIDPHPFRDEDGSWYLFYARDFLDAETPMSETPAPGAIRAGTALAMVRLASMTETAGESRTVLRARHNWQRFIVDRSMYGAVFDWHTLEGPCVRKHAGRYYCFYSGGRWETDSYGVDYAVADSALGPYSDAGGEAGPRVLRTVPGRALGPGHHSIVEGPGGTEFAAYHAWDPGMEARRLCIDPLRWTPEGPRCDGPSWLPVEIPDAGGASQ